MSDHTSFEGRFAAAVNRFADQVPAAVEADAIATLARSANKGRRAHGLELHRARRPDARLVLIAAALLLVAALAAMSLAGAWRVRPVGPSPIAVGTDQLSARPATVATDQLFRLGSKGDEGWWKAAFLTDGTVLLVGGLDASQTPSTGSAAILDPRSGVVRPTGPFATARVGASLTTLSDGRVLLVGGSDGKAALTSAEIYDPTTGAFSPAAPMPFASAGPATLLGDGRVLVTADGRAEVYDPAADSWRFVGTTAARGLNTVTRLADGRGLIVGGWGGSQRVSAASELFDPTTDTFSKSGSLALRRNQHAAVLMSDGRVLVVGGMTNPDGFTLDTQVARAEIYDPVTQSFRGAGALRYARGKPFAVALRDGRVVVWGGFDNSGPVTNLEVFNPKSRSFSVAPRAVGLTYDALAVGDGWVLGITADGLKVLVPAGSSRPAWAPPG
jgi:hypothetical protein